MCIIAVRSSLIHGAGFSQLRFPEWPDTASSGFNLRLVSASGGRIRQVSRHVAPTRFPSEGVNARRCWCYCLVWQLRLASVGNVPLEVCR